MAEYIEREAAYPLAKKICDAIDSDEFQRLNFGMRILDWIDDIPAADVRPVMRGKCTNQARYFFCSECGYGVQDVFEGNYARKDAVLVFEKGREWNYCPNCGADMRGGEQDGRL
ncbi:MAG: hypothetical protein IKD61_05575 [Oscillospiraceae bacterium]|nr:hypothetical protein [Oscillospiraceae bacterium]